MKNILFPAVISNIMERMASWSESWFVPVYAGPISETEAPVSRTLGGFRTIARLSYNMWLELAFYRTSNDVAHRLWYALGMAAFYEVDHHYRIRLNHVGYILHSGDTIAKTLEQLLRDCAASASSLQDAHRGTWGDTKAAVKRTLSKWYESAANARADIEESEDGFPIACWTNYETMIDQYYEMLWTLFSPLFTGGQLRGFKMHKNDSVGSRQWWNEFLTMSTYVGDESRSVFSLLEDRLEDLYVGD